MRLLLVLLIACACDGLAAAAPLDPRLEEMESVRVGSWTLQALAMVETGKFSHCNVTRAFDDGVDLAVGLSANDLHLSVSKPSWTFVPTDDVSLQVDKEPARKLYLGMAGGPAIQAILDSESDLVNSLRQGRLLRIRAAAVSLVLSLSGLEPALQALKACALSHGAPGKGAAFRSLDPLRSPEEEKTYAEAWFRQRIAPAIAGLRPIGSAEAQFLALDKYGFVTSWREGERAVGTFVILDEPGINVTEYGRQIAVLSYQRCGIGGFDWNRQDGGGDIATAQFTGRCSKGPQVDLEVHLLFPAGSGRIYWISTWQLAEDKATDTLVTLRQAVARNWP